MRTKRDSCELSMKLGGLDSKGGRHSGFGDS